MRTRLIRTTFVLITGLFVQMMSGQSNCKVDEMFNKNRSLLGEYQFIKHFPIETTKQVEMVQYSYVLNRDTKYRLVSVDSGVKGERMMVTIRDAGKKVLVTNKDKQKRTYLNQLDFVCPATGVYFFEVTFENDHKDCGLNILGFQK